jgi:hypothetical protein
MRRPEPQRNLREVLRRTFEDIEAQGAESAAAGASARIARRVIEVDLLGRVVTVDLAAREVSCGKQGRVDDYIAAVVARYLAQAHGLPDNPGPDVDFAEDEDARGFLAPFRGRVIAPLVGRFGGDADGFARAAGRLGAERLTDPDVHLAADLAALGAVAFRIRVFPRVALVFILHPGDEEFPPDGQVLFPREVLRAFPVEDAVSIADLTSRALRGRLWGGGKDLD